MSGDTGTAPLLAADAVPAQAVTPQGPAGRAVENAPTLRYLASVAPGTRGRLSGLAAASDLLRVGYGERFLDRPVFLDAPQPAALTRDLEALRALLATLPSRMFGGDMAALARAVGMGGPQVTAVLRSTGDRPVQLGRADLYHDGERFRMLELNMGSALGGFENAEINRALLADDELAAFVERERLGFADTLRGIVDTMVDECPDLDVSGRPVMAIVDWPSSFPSLERRLRYMAELLAPMGIDAVPCHIGQITERGGHLYVGERHIDVVYRFWLIEDLLDGPEAPAVVGRVLDAVERGTVQMFARLDAELLGNKGTLAILSDERTRESLTAAERALVDGLLPWTRFVRDEVAHADGGTVDLLDYVTANQQSLVLKPTLMHGGIGVVPGWAVTAEEWLARVRTAVNGPYVVQRRVRPAPERFPVAGENGSVLRERSLNWGVFVTARGYGGTIVRGSADPDAGVVSMANGAEVGCCFHAVGDPP